MSRKICLMLWSIVLISGNIFLMNTWAQDPQALMEASFDYMRGKASISTVKMTIHRPDWERRITLKAWTKDRDSSIFRILAPPKDQDNGTLLKAGQMWMFNPKVNRVIKIPPSMMAQSWMGSDFSNNDLAKSNSILEDYTHTLEDTKTEGGMTIYLVKSLPKPHAPVVWGMQKHAIREDYIMLSEEFFDQDLKLVKTLTTSEIQRINGKLFPMVWKMQKADAQEEYTLVEYQELSFHEDLPERLFTLQYLRTPGR